MDKIKERLTKGVAWAAATRLLVNLLAFGNTLLLARILTPSDFGLVAIASTVALVITSITELSLSSALIQHRDPREEHFHSAWTLNLLRASILAGLICALSGPAASLYDDPRLVWVMMAIGGSTLLNGAANPKFVLFSRDLVFWQDFAVGVSQKLIGILVSTLVALIYQSYWALILGLIASQISAVIVSYILAPYKPTFRLSRVRELLSFSIWLSLGQAINTLNWRADHLAIGYFLGNSALGFYSIGDNLASLPTREATGPISQTLFPGFARMIDDPNRLRIAYQRAQALLSAIGLPIGVGFALIAEPIIQLIMGEKWLPAVIVVKLLSGVFAFQTLASSVQPLAMAMGDTRGLFHRDMVILVLRLPLIFAGIALGGLQGVVYARCLSGAVGTIVNMMLVRKLLKLSIRAQLAANARALVSVSIMIIVTVALDQLVGPTGDSFHLLLKTAAMIVVGATVYCATSYCMWIYVGYPKGPEFEVRQLLLLTKRHLVS